MDSHACKLQSKPEPMNAFRSLASLPTPNELPLPLSCLYIPDERRDDEAPQGGGEIREPQRGLKENILNFYFKRTKYIRKKTMKIKCNLN